MNCRQVMMSEAVSAPYISHISRGSSDGEERLTKDEMALRRMSNPHAEVAESATTSHTNLPLTPISLQLSPNVPATPPAHVMTPAMIVAKTFVQII